MVSLVDDNSDSFLSGFVVCRVNVSIDCGLAAFVVVGLWFSMESLILAQDERWRRA
jgi:hypothetical protein